MCHARELRLDHDCNGELSMKRQRGRGRKPGGGHHHNHHQPNRTMESSGPDTKVRGPASHIYERYLQLARDAASSGDRVLSENYLQHADHYFRLVRAMQPAVPLQTSADRFGSDPEYEGEGEGEGSPEGEGQESEAVGAEGEEQPEADYPQGQQQQYERGEGGDFRRRRGRRNRFRPNPGEGESAEAREGAERPETAEKSEQRRERAPKERSDAEPQEGFSNGPRPAFLGSD
jgi:hypothetical protein